MKKNLALMPVLALSVATLALAACDDNSQQETVAADPAAVTASVETAGAPAAAPVDQAAAPVAQLITVTTPHAFATADSATTGAIFATITSAQPAADFLTGAATDVADTVEIHQTYQDPQTGTYLMRKTSGVDVPANGTATLEPAGYHIMLIGLKRPLVEGATFPVTLSFRMAGDVTTDVSVIAPGAGAAMPEAASHEGHDGHDHAAPVSDVPAAEEAPAVAVPVEAPADDAVTQ